MRESSAEDEPVYSQLTGAQVSSLLDGVRLVLTIPDASALWRTRLLLEHRLGDIAHDALKNVSDEVYIEYPHMDETEYYDLTKDPHQLDGKANKPPPNLKTHLRTLKNCAGAGCHRADGGP